MSLVRRLSVLAAGALAASTPAWAQEVRPLLMIDHAELSALAPDENDAALRRALSFLPDRLAELPAEIPDMPREVTDVVTLIVDTLARPGRLAITYNPDHVTGFFGYGVVISAETAGADEARALAQHAGFMVEQSDGRLVPQPSELIDGFTEIPTPAGSIHFGPRRVDGNWKFEIVAGSVTDPAQGFDLFADVAGDDFEPVIRTRLDLTAFTAAVNMAQMSAGENGKQMAPIRRKLEQAGLLGPDAMNFDYAVGFSDDHLHGSLRAQRARQFFEFLRLPTDSIPRSHYKAFPSDVYYASAARLDFAFVEAILDLVAEFGAPIADVEQEFREHLELDLREDLLRPLGGTMAYYTSESTGGGGFGSSVVMSTFRDRDAFLSSHAKLVRLANGLTNEIPNGFGRYISLESWKHGGVDLMSLRFPGLPVPLEITYAVTDEWFIAAGTPQAALVAAQQATGNGDDGMLSNPRLGKALPHRKGLQSFSVVDSHHTIRNGYASAQLIGSAVANMVRSPHGAKREPGLVTPTFNQLRDGLKPIVQYSVWDDEDLWTMGTSDRSILATMSSQFGAFGGGSMSSMLPMMMQGMNQGGGMNGPMFMKDPIPGPVFASTLTSVPMPYAAAGAMLYADSLDDERSSR